jgi:hypothetical protein
MVWARAQTPPQRGEAVSKDKKKKPNDKKGKKKKGSGSPVAKAPKKAARTLKVLSENPIVADVVAAALIGMASALKDSDKARRMASDAGDQLEKLSKASAKQGNAMWDLALDIGRRTLEALAAEEGARAKGGKTH